MIVDKNQPIIPDVSEPPKGNDAFEQPAGEPWEGNPMSDIFNAMRSILKDIPLDPKKPAGPKLFRTIKLNYGQLTRIKHDKHNYEGALSFPAAFIHLINVRWLVQTSRIGEGRGELRICYVLNRLNNEDDEYQTEGFEVFQRINQAINARKAEFPSFTERLQLTYWDQVENFDEGLQQYWITYEVWFKDYTTYQYKDYVDRYIVMPPFTNHADQQPGINQDNHTDHDDPAFEDVAGFSH